jgi:hypothetical protein
MANHLVDFAILLFVYSVGLPDVILSIIALQYAVLRYPSCSKLALQWVSSWVLRYRCDASIAGFHAAWFRLPSVQGWCMVVTGFLPYVILHILVLGLPLCHRSLAPFMCSAPSSLRSMRKLQQHREAVNMLVTLHIYQLLRRVQWSMTLHHLQRLLDGRHILTALALTAVEPMLGIQYRMRTDTTNCVVLRCNKRRGWVYAWDTEEAAANFVFSFMAYQLCKTLILILLLISGVEPNPGPAITTKVGFGVQSLRLPNSTLAAAELDAENINVAQHRVRNAKNNALWQPDADDQVPGASPSHGENSPFTCNADAHGRQTVQWEGPLHHLLL